MKEQRSRTEVAVLIALVSAALTPLLGGELLGRAVSIVLALVLLAGVTLWWFRHKVPFRFRSPVYRPRSQTLSPEEQRRGLKKHLIQMAGLGDNIAHYPRHRQEPWRGRLHDIITASLGEEMAKVVTDWPSHDHRLVALRQLLAELDNKAIRPDFNPRDIPPGMI